MPRLPSKEILQGLADVEKSSYLSDCFNAKIGHSILSLKTFLQQAQKSQNGPKKLWDERTGKCLAEFFNNIRADSLVVEMGVEEGRMLSTSELIMLLRVPSTVYTTYLLWLTRPVVLIPSPHLAKKSPR